jgi:hypothetical protein
MSQDNEDFLRRWSRRKRDAAQSVRNPAQPEAAAPAVELPALDSLNFESDFKAFMQAKVEEGVKRAALKKLFSDPRFNVMDGLDVYIDDYTKGETLTPEMVALLEHAKNTLLGPKQQEEEKLAEKAPEPDSKPKDDGPPGQNA